MQRRAAHHRRGRVGVTLLLALDTSTRIASVAVFDGQQVLSETSWLAGREHSTRLLVEADATLDRVGRAPADLSGLVVARGPGSFTGVRVALSVAKGIAAALDIPAWGVSSLDVLAHAAETSLLPVRAVLEAGRGRYATALYERGQSVDAPRLATLDQLCDLLAQPTLVIGELNAEARATLQASTPTHLASAAASVRRAGYLAELGWRAMRAGEAGDPRLLDALYVR
jgi:tRNA threonylcarbamoyladenosine biosynthesis protein TsaB